MHAAAFQSYERSTNGKFSHFPIYCNFNKKNNQHQVTSEGMREKTSSCAKGGLHWISGKTALLKGLSLKQASQGSHCAWRNLKDGDVALRNRSSGGLVDVGQTDSMILRVFSNQNDSVFL